MKKITLPALALLTLVACNNSGSADKKVELTPNIDSVSYAIGMNSARKCSGN